MRISESARSQGFDARITDIDFEKRNASGRPAERISKPPSAAEDSHNPPPELPATLPADHLAAFNKLMSSSMERMHTDMMVAPSGDPDRDFARMMIPHHQGAVDMAKA